MGRKSILILGVLALAISAFQLGERHTFQFNQSSGVEEVLIALGEPVPEHYISNPTSEMVEKGKELVTKGRTTTPEGKVTSFQSKHYLCTHCHNVEREDPDLRFSNPETRLEYSRENNIPFLQGTTLYGVVNRKSWYNGDYVKKYGSLVEKANKNVKEAIQLCAVECSQGRELNDWEMEAVLSYLWSLQLTLEDLALTDSEIKNLNHSTHKPNFDGWAGKLKDKYLDHSPATFVEPEKNKDLSGNAENGAAIYDLSCMHCHDKDGVTNFVLDYSKMNFRFLKRHLYRNNKFAIHYISRKGTAPKYGYKPYMPHYTLERMSEQQVADLEAFIKDQASRKKP